MTTTPRQTIALRAKTGRRVRTLRLYPFGTPTLLRFTTEAWQRDAFPHGHVFYVPPRGPASPSLSILMVP